MVASTDLSLVGPGEGHGLRRSSYPDYHIDSNTEIIIENYVFSVNSHSRNKGSRTLDDAVLSLLEDKANRTFANRAVR